MVVKSYTEDDIEVLEGLDGCRKKPAMYVGIPDSHGIFHLLKEAIDNSLDEALGGHNDIVGISFDGKTKRIQVWDHGRGIPVGKHKKINISTLTLVLTKLHAGGKLDAEQEGYEYSIGTHGVGIAVTNALSVEFVVSTFRDNQWYTQSFEKGKETTTVKKCSAPIISIDGSKNKPIRLKKGTLVSFIPDFKCFNKGASLNETYVKNWLDNTSYIYPTVKFSYYSISGLITYHQPNGLEDLRDKILKDLNAQPSGESFTYKSQTVDVVLQWSDHIDEKIKSYANGSETSDGGTHVLAINKCISESLKDFRKKNSIARIEDLRAGLIAIVNVKLASPQFDSQTKNRLISKEAGDIINKEVSSKLLAFFKLNKELARDIVTRADQVREAQQQLVLNKQAAAQLKPKKGKSSLPAKLSVSLTKIAKDRELFLVEGDSASGTARNARDKYYQDVLPLRGKVISAYKDKTSKILASSAVIDILKSIGYDPTLPDPTSNLRVGRIILLPDADVDGPLHGDTRVHLLDGTTSPISDLAAIWKENKEPIWVYSIDSKGNMVPSLAHTIEEKYKADYLVEITLDNDHKIYSTPDHQFPIYATTIDVRPRSLGKSANLFNVPAIDLKIGDILHSIYFKFNANRIKELKNHVITNIKTVKNENPEPVYCLTTDHGNFFIDDGEGNGVCTMNCHIGILLTSLLHKIVPKVIEMGMLYVIDAPLYTAYHSNTRHFGSSLANLLKKLPKTYPAENITRIKGWGEIDGPVLREIAFDPKKRKLTKILPIKGEKLNQFLGIVGDDVAMRKELLGL